MSDRHAVCFTCGHSVATNPFENRLEDGRACPTCRDRLLDEVAGALPTSTPQTAGLDVDIDFEVHEETDEERALPASYPFGRGTADDDPPMPA